MSYTLYRKKLIACDNLNLHVESFIQTAGEIQNENNKKIEWEKLCHFKSVRLQMTVCITAFTWHSASYFRYVEASCLVGHAGGEERGGEGRERGKRKRKWWKVALDEEGS